MIHGRKEEPRKVKRRAPLAAEGGRGVRGNPRLATAALASLLFISK